MAACVHFFGVAFYAFFCSGEIQPWADSSVEEQKAWNPLGELSQTGPPVRPPPMTMQSEFIVRISSFSSTIKFLPNGTEIKAFAVISFMYKYENFLSPDTTVAGWNNKPGELERELCTSTTQ